MDKHFEFEKEETTATEKEVNNNNKEKMSLMGKFFEKRRFSYADMFVVSMVILIVCASLMYTREAEIHREVERYVEEALNQPIYVEIERGIWPFKKAVTHKAYRGKQ